MIIYSIVIFICVVLAAGLGYICGRYDKESSNQMKMESKYRIIKRGERYIPQYRHLIYLGGFWDEFEVDDDAPTVLGFDTQEEAEEFIERELGGENDEVVKEYF